MPEKQYFEGIDVKSGSTVITSVDVADSEARADLSDLEDYVETITAVELISRADWNALPTADKLAKGLVAIADTSTGYDRGQLVNGADYIERNKYIPYSNNDNILCEAYADNFDSTSISWGVGSNPVTFTGTGITKDVTEEAVYIPVQSGTSVRAKIDLEYTQRIFTAYFVMKLKSGYSSGGRYVGMLYTPAAQNGILLWATTNSRIQTGDWDTVVEYTWSSASDYIVFAISSNGYETSCHLYNPSATSHDDTRTFNLDTISRYINFGISEPDTGTTPYTVPADVYVRYTAVSNVAESNTVISNNLANLYSEFVSS